MQSQVIFTGCYARAALPVLRLMVIKIYAKPCRILSFFVVL